MTPLEFSAYLFNAATCLGFGACLGKLWVLMTGAVL
jgi:hypothetical protein